MTGTSSAVATRNGHAPAAQTGTLAIYGEQTAWTEMQNAALAQLGIRDASDGDKAVFLHQCQRTGLDPFSRQIYMIGRQEKVPGSRDQWRTKWTIQTGIDGWRVIRSRAERREGMRGILGRTVYYDPDGGEHKVWVRREPPVACEITYTVIDATGETPYTSVLRFNEYVQTKDGNPVAQWATKPAHMLEKCTEADVYRKAFPQDFSGIYLDDAMPPVRPEDMTDEELDRFVAERAPNYRPRVTAAQVRRTVAAEMVTQDAASGDTPAPEKSPEAASAPDSRASAAQVARINGHGHRLGWGQSPDDLEGIVSAVNRYLRLDPPVPLKKLTSGQADDVCAEMAKFGEGDAQGFLDLINDGVMPRWPVT